MNRRHFLHLLGSVSLGATLLRSGSGNVRAQGAGLWTDRAAMPSRRGEVTACALGTRVYVMGDYGPGSRLTEAYEASTDQWFMLSPLPRGIHHAASASLDGFLYVAGGYDISSDYAVKSLYRYDPSSDQWTTLQPMPIPRGALGLVAVNGVLHAIAGEGGGNTPAHEVYVPAQDRWTTAQPIPTPRDHLAIAELGGLIYVIGGRLPSHGMNLTETEAYDPETDQWTSLAPLPTGRSGIAGAALDGRIYVFGGEDSRRTYNDAESFDPLTNSWMTHTVMPYARHGLVAAAIAGTIYVIGGGLTPGLASSDLNLAFQPGL